MNTEVIKTFADSLYSRFVAYDQEDVFVALLTIADNLLDHLKPEQLPDVLSDETIREEALEQLAGIGNHLSALGAQGSGFAGERCGEIQKQLQKTRIDIDKTRENLDSLASREKELDALLPALRHQEECLQVKEGELLQKEKEQQALTSNITRLQRLEQENTPEILERLAKEYEDLTARTAALRKQREEQEKLLDDMKAAAGLENGSVHQISAQILKLLEDRADTCAKLSDGHLAKITVFRESVNSLLKMEADNKEILTHINENHHVLEGFRKAGFLKEGDAPKKAEELAVRADEILKEYDSFLGNLLESARKERDEITRRQKTVKEGA